VITRDGNAVLLAKSILKDVPVYFMPGSLVKMDMRFDNERMGSVLYRMSRGIQSFIRVAMERWAFSRADQVIVFSEWLKAQISKHYDLPAEKIVVLPMGINVRETSGNGSVEKGMILSVGRLAKSKNLQTAIAAMKELDGYHLFIAGDGPQRRTLEEQIRKMNLQDRVSLLGKQNDLSSYYHRCDVFLHLSYYENFGQVLLEAMLYGKPPIVLDPMGAGVHTASAELIHNGSNGFFVANDPVAVGTKIREVAAMEKQPMENNCRRFAGQFTFERHLEALGRLLEERRA
jgi:glycosyltransferase involved in cell wall biosynthesis